MYVPTNLFELISLMVIVLSWLIVIYNLAHCRKDELSTRMYLEEFIICLNEQLISLIVGNYKLLISLALTPDRTDGRGRRWRWCRNSCLRNWADTWGEFFKLFLHLQIILHLRIILRLANVGFNSVRA
jgi:hypothetical protein